MGFQRHKDKIEASEPVSAVLRAGFIVLKEGIELLVLGCEKTDLARHKRKYVSKLARTLTMQRQTVMFSISNFIMASCSNVDQASLDEDPLAYLENKDIQDELKQFIGEKAFESWTEHLKWMGEMLEEVTCHLDDLVPSPKGRQNNLIGIIKANEIAQKHKLDIASRLKIVFSSTDMMERVKELGEAINAFSAFSTTVLANRQASTGPLASLNAVKLANAFRRIQESSKNLYMALCRCSIGSCHDEHDVHVLLEDRFDMASNILRSKKRRNEENEAILAFQLIFGAKALSPIRTRYHELSVRCMQGDDSADSLQELGSKLSRVTIREPEPTASNDSDFVPVDDFCAAIVTAHDAQNIALVLHRSKRIGFVAAGERTILKRDCCQTITLKDILSGISSSDASKLPLMSSMMLASKLASSMLQFSQTRWHSQALSKDSIFFLLQTESNGATALADFERPFVRTKFEGGGVSGEEILEPRSVLLELGILLLELWHQTGFENRFAEKMKQMQRGCDYYSRLSLAMEWLDDRYNPPLESYEAAVRYCIHGASIKHRTDWNEIELWSEICEGVIEPLSTIREQWGKFKASTRQY